MMENHNYYANFARVNWNTQDFQLIFFNQSCDDNGERTEPQRQAQITMSPQFAKKVAVLLSDMVRDYEKNLGTINVNDNPV
jgi:hypothetical protein